MRRAFECDRKVIWCFGVENSLADIIQNDGGKDSTDSFYSEID